MTECSNFMPTEIPLSASDLKQLREAKGLTQQQITEQLCLGEKTWTRWENQEEQPSASMLLLIRLWKERDTSNRALDVARDKAITTWSALENWGRHFDWCFVKQHPTGTVITDESAACSCGFMKAKKAAKEAVAEIEAALGVEKP